MCGSLETGETTRSDPMIARTRDPMLLRKRTPGYRDGNSRDVRMPAIKW